MKAYSKDLRLKVLELVFIDESGFTISMDRLRARAPRGKRAYGRVPRNRGKNQTLIASITLVMNYAVEDNSPKLRLAGGRI